MRCCVGERGTTGVLVWVGCKLQPTLEWEEERVMGHNWRKERLTRWISS